MTQTVASLVRRAHEASWSVTQLDWATPVDLSRPWLPAPLFPLHGTAIVSRMSPREVEHLRHEVCCWVISQLFHGEVDALAAALELQAMYEELQAMYALEGVGFLATQAQDEARHVAVFKRYLDRKLGEMYPRCPELARLRVLTAQAESWDMKVLAVQVVLEGLGLATLGTMLHFAETEPLLRRIVQLVLRDEARHVTFGVVALRPRIADLTEATRRHREDFVCELVRLMRDRMLCEQVWERAGLPVQACADAVYHSPGQVGHRRIMFAKIVSALDHIGLLNDRLRGQLDQLGALRPRREPRIDA